MNPERLAALEMASGLPPTPKNLLRVGSKTSPEAASWAFSQWELRVRAGAKFDRAEQMLFVREALEQATHLAVARWRAARFPAGLAVYDLGCGIGGDLIALAERGPVVGWEPDAERRFCAEWNLRVYGFEGEVLDQTVDEVSLEGIPASAGLFADPARRVGGSRTLDPDQFSPNVRLVAERMRHSPCSALKLSPLCDDAFLQRLAERVEFVSYRGECREALLWFGDQPAGVFAAQVESGEVLERAEASQPQDEPHRFLFDADPAAVRAHALGSLCQRHGLAPLGGAPGYLTGPSPIESPWLRAYEVVWGGGGSMDEVRKALASLGAHVFEIKKRGVPNADPAKWMKSLRAAQGEALSLVLYPRASGPSGKIRAILARPV